MNAPAESTPIPAGLAEYARLVCQDAPPATPEQRLRIAQICARPAASTERRAS